jgi:hypothetical protein
MVYNRGEIHGKMEFTARIAQSHLAKTLHTFFKSRIKLVVSSTFRHLGCTGLLEVMVALQSPAARGSLSHSLHPQEISLFSRVIGLSKTTL